MLTPGRGRFLSVDNADDLMQENYNYNLSSQMQKKPVKSQFAIKWYAMDQRTRYDNAHETIYSD